MTIEDDILQEGLRMTRRAQELDLPLKLLGGVAVGLLCTDARSRPALRREYQDLDFATSGKKSRSVRDLIVAERYQPNAHFNAVHGATRLLFYDLERQRQMDVFVGTFSMCHKLDLAGRLGAGGPTLPPAELLLLKLQIVELTDKDVIDAISLLLTFPVDTANQGRGLHLATLLEVCSNDWGWYTSLQDNLERVRERVPRFLDDDADREVVVTRIRELTSGIDSAPKSLSWRMRARVGRRVKWYEVPEEAAR